MVELFKNYKKDQIKMVGVRTYEGEQDGKYVWTFLGYDFVKEDEKGKTISALADERVEYEYLPIIGDEDRLHFGMFCHNDLNVGDIRIVNCSAMALEILKKPIILKKSLIDWIDRNPDYYFLYHQPEKNKVKTIGSKK